eukprot:2955472-Alexandrium_andersonii.AAC.1
MLADDILLTSITEQGIDAGIAEAAHGEAVDDTLRYLDAMGGKVSGHKCCTLSDSAEVRALAKRRVRAIIGQPI